MPIKTTDSFPVGSGDSITVDASAEHPRKICNGNGANLYVGHNAIFEPAQAQKLPKGDSLTITERVWLRSDSQQSSVIVTDAPAKP